MLVLTVVSMAPVWRGLVKSLKLVALLVPETRGLGRIQVSGLILSGVDWRVVTCASHKMTSSMFSSDENMRSSELVPHLFFFLLVSVWTHI